MARRGAIALIVLLAATIELTAASHEGRIHVDEAWMINRGFLAGQLYMDYWGTHEVGPGWESWVWQPRKPPLGNVVVGVGLWLGGVKAPRRLYRYDWHHDYSWNLAHRDSVNLPTTQALHAARMLIPLFSGAATAAVFLLAAGVGGSIGGLVAAAMFFFNPVVQDHGSRALSDMVMMSFSLWAVWHLARRIAPAWDGAVLRLLGRCAYCGAIVGLAAATKQNGGLVAGTAVVLFALWGCLRHAGLGTVTMGRSLIAAMTLLVVSYGLFVAVNPQLHPAPFKRTLAHIEAWRAKFEEHQRRRPGQALESAGARVAAVARVLAGRRFATLPYPNLTAFLAIAGLTLIAFAPRPLGGARSLPDVLLVWSAVTVGLVATWIPLDWDRYYLPIIAVGSVLSGGIGRVVPWLR